MHASPVDIAQRDLAGSSPSPKLSGQYDSKQCSRAWLAPRKACTERAEAPKGAINSIVQTSEYDSEEYSRGYLTSGEDPNARDDSPNADEYITKTGEYDLQGTF